MREIDISTERKTQLVEITREVEAALNGVDGATAALVFVPHTTAGVTINEHADPAVARDLEAAMERVVGEDWGWQHIEAGEENAPSHVRAALAGPQVLDPDRGRAARARHVAGHLLLRVRRPPEAKGLRHSADLSEAERPPSASPTVISARKVVKRYGRTVALAGLDADIGPGITGLLGSNGAGKTTFISLVLGLRSRDGGALTVLGKDPATAGIEVRSRIGYAPEHHDLPTELAATDLVRHLAEMHLMPRRAAVQRANDALWLVGLGEERFRPVGLMSTGQRQRVKLASAIAHDPELVLLDEPTDGLDPMQRTEMLALIRRIGTEFGVNIVLSSHHLEEAERICDAVVIVEGGEVVRAGTLADLRRGPEGLVVEVDERADELASMLAARGLDVTLDGAVLLLGAADDVYDTIRDAVAELGVGLRRLEPRGRTLEDVYLGVGA